MENAGENVGRCNDEASRETSRALGKEFRVLGRACLSGMRVLKVPFAIGKHKAGSSEGVSHNHNCTKLGTKWAKYLGTTLHSTCITSYSFTARNKLIQQ